MNAESCAENPLRSAKKALLLSGIFVVVISAQVPCVAKPAQKASSRPQDVYKRLTHSVFVVEALSEAGRVISTGSGVAVGPDLVITNEHVIQAGTHLRVRSGDKQWEAVVAGEDVVRDLCLLKVMNLHAAPVEIRISRTLEVGERVYAIGTPEGMELTLSEGIISGLREFGKRRLIQTTVPLSKGSSGGGLFDAEARLVGITAFSMVEGQNLNFALPGEWVMAVRDRSKGDAGPKAVPDSSIVGWYAKGLEAGGDSEWNEAVLAFENVVRLAPGDPDAWALLGIAYSGIADHHRAEQALVEAIRLDPTNANTLTNLGWEYFYLARYDRAVTAFRNSIKQNPQVAEPWDGLGLSYVELKRLDLAVEAHAKAVNLGKDTQRLWFNLGVACLKAKRNDQALTALLEATRLGPNDPDAWHMLGLAYAAEGKRSDVMRVYEVLKAISPSKAEYFFKNVVIPK